MEACFASSDRYRRDLNRGQPAASNTHENFAFVQSASPPRRTLIQGRGRFDFQRRRSDLHISITVAQSRRCRDDNIGARWMRRCRSNRVASSAHRPTIMASRSIARTRLTHGLTTGIAAHPRLLLDFPVTPPVSRSRRHRLGEGKLEW